ncbi:prolyl oligopeptidase family serine peptidase [Myroides odoratimimus]|uniref:alpha/beta hydrolase family protein n=1 Tax=Myroides TaxID=76831 RepID=UPI0025792250|nr:prolyl oligopeptidase family serine peptidase [Myroides odoratimimus]MDM1035125.1 prolyl oligopeptidase family serine peptidase [Myroides odoratimimus]MDM1038863.1 prolyl oligopeptidase family serine peptidase [Myroides odoratimimus]MDM1052957.1 prolyl oligopeptidase family serine peptidase [Myroides odoratimimus]MDM1402384.1 prolyl oligopeptidase family serine peptidase [Myroides odoratimimus]MDM1415469.1 prolyl oligopeptidase family serine peptidase [Myroides odoratimimus]
MKRKSFLIGAILATTFTFTMLTSCNSDDNKNKVENEKEYVSEKDYTLDKLDEASSIKIMTYNMPYLNGKNQHATALIMYPKTPKPKDGYRIVVWAHGTVGVADACAPSSNPLGENFKVTAKALLAQGYVIVAPDYEGLGTPGIHPYLHLKSEALSATYAIKAVKEKYTSEFNGDWMSAGQSQGGQASLGIAELANNDTTYKGAVAGAPASSLGKIILEVAPVALAKIEAMENASPTPIPLEKRSSVTSYATLLAYAALAGVGIKAETPSYDYTAIFEDRAKNFAKLAEGSNGDNGDCLDGVRQAFMADIIKYMNEDPSNKVMTYPGLNNEKFKNDPIIQKFLQDSQPGTQKIDKPILVIQGQADTNVPAIVTQGMVKGLQDLGSPSVEIILVEGAGHTQAIVWKNDELVKFINKYMPAQ